MFLERQIEMATWHQERHPVRLWHPTLWIVVIDPPGQMRALVTFSSRELAEVYMRGLRENNPGAARHSYILKPKGK